MAKFFMESPEVILSNRIANDVEQTRTASELSEINKKKKENQSHGLLKLYSFANP